MSLDAQGYREAFHREAAALAIAARCDLQAPIPPCPGWNMPMLLSHLASIYASRIALVRRDARENVIRSYEDLDLPPRFKEWFVAQGETDSAEHMPDVPPGLLELFEETAGRLEDVLWAVAPETPVWTWWPPDQTAGFWQRRMAQETAVHRWDAEVAVGEPVPIEAALARDGIDEALDIMLPSSRGRNAAFRRGAGETYHFHCTDGPGEWLVRFDGDAATVTHEHAKGDIAVRGTASDLLLFLWGRIPGERLEVFGDSALLERYFELVPTG